MTDTTTTEPALTGGTDADRVVGEPAWAPERQEPRRRSLAVQRAEKFHDAPERSFA